MLYDSKKGRIYFSFIVATIAVLITILLQWGLFASFFFPETSIEIISVPLDDMGFVEIDEEEIEEMIEFRRYVSNYDAKIYIELKNNPISLDDYVEFTVNIVDNGIIPLEKPYFQMFLVNPLGEVASAFPEASHISPSYKLGAWTTHNHSEDFYRDCLRYQSLYLPRSTLIEGYGKYVYVYSGHLYWSDSSEIVYRHHIEEDTRLIGDWKVYVFVLDEEYYDRTGIKLDYVNSEEEKNFVQYSFYEFQVVSQSLPQPVNYSEVFNKYISSPVVFLITLVLNYVGIYPILEKHKEKIDIAFPSKKVAVFVDGCFWHGCPLHSHVPKSNIDYWIPKLEKNKERAILKNERLKNSGWKILHFWEHEVDDLDSILNKIKQAL